MFELTEKDADRFWPKVKKGAGCWIWTAARSHDGYGLFRVGASRRLGVGRGDVTNLLNGNTYGKA